MEVMILNAFVALVAIVVSLLVLSILGYSVYILYIRSRYSHLPCPQPCSFFMGHLTVINNGYKTYGCFEELWKIWAEEYGHTYVIYLMHVPIVFTCTPEFVQELQVTGNFPKSKRYGEIATILGQRVLGSGLATDLNNDRWSVRRHDLNPVFHRQALKELMTEFNIAGDEFIRKLGKHADNKDQIQLITLLNKIALDVIGKVAFCQDLNSLNEDDNIFNRAVTDVFSIFNESLMDPLLKLPFRAHAIKKRLREAMKTLHDTGKKWLTERQTAMDQGDYVPDDILSSLVKIKKKYQEIGEHVILDDITTFFVAGQETTANALAFLFMETGRHPEIMERMYDEIDNVIGSKSVVTFEDLAKLEYITLILKETLRMYSVAPVTFRDINRDNYSIDGYKLPRDTIVMMSSYVSSRMPEFVKDPLTFMPERFAPDSEYKPNTYAYFPFALGPRNCIGQNFAQMEAKVLIVKLLQNFTYELDPNQSFRITESTTLKPQDGVKCTVVWRKK